MPFKRQHRSGRVNPILIAFLIPLVVIGATAMFMLVRHFRHASLEKFNTNIYLQGPKELVGNRYDLDAQVESQLATDDGFGRLLAVKPLDGSGAISVFLPQDVGGDIRVGQRFHFRVVIKDMGLIQAEGLDKY